MGEHAPPFSQLQQQLQSCLDTVISLSQYAKTDSLPINNHKKSITLKSEPKIKKENFNSREDALNAISQASSYFRSTEPHSPLPYLLEKALTWGKLDFPALLRELIHDESMRNQIYRLTGVKEH